MGSAFTALWKQRASFKTLVIGDFTQNYLASYLGFAWAVLGPLVMIGVMTAVFQFGFRVGDSGSGVPFALWLACGMVPWQYLSEGFTAGAGAITAYRFLVRKAVFRMSYLPAIRLLAGSLIHGILVLFLVGLLLTYGVYPDRYWLQGGYYFVCMFLLLLGAAWCSAAIAVFVPDIVNAIGIGVNLGFWLTPIFWNISMLPEKWQPVIQMNPIYYIVQGYRDSLIEQRWVWERPAIEHIAFFAWLFVALFVGARIFKKLRPHFADVL